MTPEEQARYELQAIAGSLPAMPYGYPEYNPPPVFYQPPERTMSDIFTKRFDNGLEFQAFPPEINYRYEF